ncbi:MAG: hypothetical protein N2C14_10170, partial [Planctomycetales bacterium]
MTGRQNGYIEPCGCSGLENKKGGLARRFSLLEQLQRKGWTLAPVDVGGQVKRSGPQAEIKFHRTMAALRKMNYVAATFGGGDLQLPVGDLASAALDEQGALCSANVGLFELDSGITPRYRIVKSGGRTLGITAVLADSGREKIKNGGDLACVSAVKALREVVPKMKPKADFLILLSHGSLEESRELAKRFPDFNLVISSGGSDEPPRQPERIPGGKTFLLQVGAKGMHAGVLALYDDAHAPWRYQRVRLNKDFAEAGPMKKLMAEYQSQLKDLGLPGLGLRPVRRPDGREFVGSATCGECHETAYRIW